MIKKIVLHGPESSGKTTLAQQLARHYATVWSPEYTRVFLETRVYMGGVEAGNFSLEPADVVGLVAGQIAVESLMLPLANRLLFCDTGVLTNLLYCHLYFGFSPAWLHELVRRHPYDFYLLTHPDTPWVADGMRDLPHHRTELFQLFRQELIQRNLPFAEISGLGNVRLLNAIYAVETYLTGLIT